MRVVEQEAVVEFAQFATRRRVDLRLVGEDRAHLRGVDSQHRIGEVGTAVHARNHSRGKPYDAAWRTESARPDQDRTRLVPCPGGSTHAPTAGSRVLVVRAPCPVGLCVEHRRHRWSSCYSPKRGSGRQRSGGGGGGCSVSSESAAVTVNIQNFAFAPAEVTAAVGRDDQLDKSRLGGAHRHDRRRRVRHRQHRAGRNGRARVRCSGTYPYHCNIHPNMTGTITITE